MENLGILLGTLLGLLFILVPLGYLFYLVCKLIKAWINKLNRN